MCAAECGTKEHRVQRSAPLTPAEAWEEGPFRVLLELGVGSCRCILALKNQEGGGPR